MTKLFRRNFDRRFTIVAEFLLKVLELPQIVLSEEENVNLLVNAKLLNLGDRTYELDPLVSLFIGLASQEYALSVSMQVDLEPVLIDAVYVSIFIF